MSDKHAGSHHSEPEPYPALRTKALESLLIEKALVSSDVIDEVVNAYERDIGPLNGAKVVVKAWINPEYRSRLLVNGTDAIAELGFKATEGAGGSNIVVLENTPKVHNMVVCTLCSCYPWPVLGLPPSWYKAHAYRSRAVIEPRSVLREFGLDLDDSVEVRVWDSTAEMRYMVLPERPEGTEHLSEEELIPLITRDTMIGVAKVKASTEVK